MEVIAGQCLTAEWFKGLNYWKSEQKSRLAGADQLVTLLTKRINE